ncbi:hypothetical protein [Chitinophaga silvisoli]|uniref:Uncharacterized protein n=1 Tax=Chitinophaga silvisoli TaxID=2291814 RepID=A0A3E1P644_9BACT|nr:hypothetical protein [Chitinophaga silvisoli]RFM35570.1 hypothetical protein DXN04_09325 [Chitinophaga silvisoli]
MKNKDLKNKTTGNEHIPTQEELEAKRDQAFPGYPTYPASEDIMNNEEREDLDVEGVTGSRRINNEIAREEGSIPQEFSEEDDDLDIPGAELDDEEESIGEEDEENNYYSLGGDRHEDLDETNEDDI